MTPQRTWTWPAKQRELWTGKNLRWSPNDWELWRESGVTPRREPFDMVRHHEETLQVYERIADTIRVLPYVAAAVEMMRTHPSDVNRHALVDCGLCWGPSALD